MCKSVKNCHFYRGHTSICSSANLRRSLLLGTPPWENGRHIFVQNHGLIILDNPEFTKPSSQKIMEILFQRINSVNVLSFP